MNSLSPALRSAARSRPALAPAALVPAMLAGPPLICTVASVHELLYDHADALRWVLAMATVWPLLLRHRAPVAVFWFCWAAALGSVALGSVSVPAFAVLVALYTVAAHRSTRYSLAAAAASEVGVVLLAVQIAPAGSVNDGVIILTGLAAAVFLLGTTMRAQRRYLASVEDRAQRLEQERVQQQQLAAASERTRIAREMHDIVAHGLVVVIALSEAAAATAGTDPEAARGQMLQSASTGRQSLAGMRRLLGMLRADDGVDRAPQPDLEALRGLVEETRRTGLDVRLTETGSRETLSTAAQTTLYRIVQESLTNVVKHAPDASKAEVLLDWGTDRVRFAVTDDGRRTSGGTGALAPTTGAGNGLTGMRERVAMFDGELRAGPTATGWAVTGELGLEEAR
ncbi:MULTISPECIES: sensor histidine kinase [Streptacidiphilus]|uniref:histidine kinase n=1 Tax=Streptacidiphilus cavernicola TaxID=3342716 RepID=A0ABV6UPP7_9ACTN|nr:histidine kinase [Streptacidiphilus jeojiense]